MGTYAPRPEESHEKPPHARVSLEDGTVVVDTDKVSAIGLEKLPAVFEAAASMASSQLEAWNTQKNK